MVSKWYETPGLAIGVMILLGGLGIGSCTYMRSRLPSYNSPQAQKADLNQNGTPETFYTIEGKIAVTEVDNEPILDFLKRNHEKK